MKPLYALLAVIAAWAGGYGVANAISAPRDGFILAMEQAFGVVPGIKKPVMQCQCSVEYIGTKAQGGGIYAVLIKKLD
jgi:hypothetical protein